MLQDLKIQNYALIAELEVRFYDGFSVITGETGAGKSIILGAISLILGGRADVKSIRDGATKCVVEAVFEFKNGDDRVGSFMLHNDFDYDGHECIVRREISKSGKSRAFINDTPATVVQLRELGESLVDIHSQHQNLLVSGSEFQMDVLDTVAGDAKEREEYSLCYKNLRREAAELEKLKQEIAQRRSDEDYIRYSLQQFDAAALREGEEEELEAEQKKLAHAEEITEALTTTYRLLNNEEGGTISSLARCTDEMERISAFLPEAKELGERMQSVCIELQDICEELGERVENDEFDPARMQEVDERLSLIYDMERKFHVASYKELIDKEQELRKQVETIDDSDELLAEKQKLCDALLAKTREAGARLTKKRVKAASKLSQEMVELLIPLGMPNVRFKVEVRPAAQAGASGIDDVVYLFSSSKSSELREISAIASGGEIARIMLCLKSIISTVKGLPTIIFDEIDTGVSGRIAEQMAKTMLGISNNGTQVICITHLPQIASRGGHHYRVYKDEATTTHIELLSEQGREQEIAKMLSGDKITAAAISNARELLKTAPRGGEQQS